MFDIHFTFAVLFADDGDSDDSLKEFLKEPIRVTAKVVKKRRISDLACPPMTDFTARKKTMPVHSSVLAIMNKSPLIILPKENGEPKMAEEIFSSPILAAVKIKTVSKTAGKFHTHTHTLDKNHSPGQATHISIASHLCVFYVLPLQIEKETEPIPNILNSNSPERNDNYTKFMELKERMNPAKIAAQKGTILHIDSIWTQFIESVFEKVLIISYSDCSKR